MSTPRLQLDFDQAWRLEPVADEVRFLAALPTLDLEQATLYLEGTTDRRVEEFLSSRPTDPGVLIKKATVWPPSDSHHMALSSDNIESLSLLIGQVDVDHLAHHVHVYTATGVVMQWYDAFGSMPIYVAGEVDEERVRRFATSLGVLYERGTAS